MISKFDMKNIIGQIKGDKILDIIYQKGYELPTNIHRWLRSSNDSIVLIAIKMLVRYNTKPSYDQLRKLFTHRNTTVQKEIINAVRKLRIVEANDLLMECYQTETNLRIKIALVKALQNTANTTNLSFALKILQLETEVDLKFEWVNCLCKMDRNFMNYIRVEDDQEKRLIQQMVLHHTNPYIN